MRIGILQTGRARENLRAEYGDYDDQFRHLLRETDHAFTTYAVLDGTFPIGLTEQDGWLITGSRFAVYEAHAWIPRLEGLLRDIYAADVPMVGICFGHQILAQALGGKVEKFEGGWSIGPTAYACEGYDHPLTINAYHQDQVTRRPKDATVLASSGFCENAALIYGTKALTIQAHPEFQNGYINAVISAPSAPQPKSLIATAKSTLKTQTLSPELASMVDRFFRKRAL